MWWCYGSCGQCSDWSGKWHFRCGTCLLTSASSKDVSVGGHTVEKISSFLGTWVPRGQKWSSLWFYPVSTVQFSSVAQSYPTPCDPMNRSTPGLSVHHQLPKFTQTHVHQVSDAIQPSHPLSPLLLLPPIPPSIRVFSNESTLRMRWPKYWSFSFSIIPSKEIPGLISFRMDWLDLLAVQGTLESSPP